MSPSLAPTRRTLVKGAVWAAPAVAVAAAAPSASASCTPTTVNKNAWINVVDTSSPLTSVGYRVSTDPSGGATTPDPVPAGFSWTVRMGQTVTSATKPTPTGTGTATVAPSGMVSVSLGNRRAATYSNGDGTWDVYQTITLTTLRVLQPGEGFTLNVTNPPMPGNANESSSFSSDGAYREMSTTDGCVTTVTDVGVDNFGGAGAGG